jgi:O6-methylguanine-DNA--protein-cysteine methyltransferase
MTHLILMEVADLVRSHLHPLLTQQDQEGEMTRKGFRRMAYPMIRQCVDEIAEMFGEDATVTVDLNLECYGQRSMRHLYQADLKIAFGVVREGEWKTVVLGEGWQEQMIEWLA